MVFFVQIFNFYPIFNYFLGPKIDLKFGLKIKIFGFFEVDSGTAVTRMTGGLDPTLAGIGLFPDGRTNLADQPREPHENSTEAEQPASFSVVQNTSDALNRCYITYE